MAIPSLLTFASLVTNAAAAVQSRASALIKLTTGSVTLAVLEATASTALWLQYVALAILSSTRLSTSTGSDVDTWVGDFGLTRLPAVAATGIVSLSRYTATSGATVPVGATVRSGDLSRTYAVTADPTSAYYDATVGFGVGGYVVPAGVLSIDVPVVATVAGTVGNVVASGVSLIGTALAGIDSVTNAVAITDGVDEESDASLKARFVLFIGSLSRGTLVAIESAVAGVQQGLSFSVQVTRDEVGHWRPGYFVVTVDDGTGHPSAALIASVVTAVTGVKSACELFSVQPPVILEATVSLTLTVGPGGNKVAIAAKVVSAITSYVNGLGIDSPLPYSRLAALAYGADPSVTNVSNLLVNGGTADLAPGQRGVVKLAASPVVT